ncbi:G-protein coupled receptor Mth2-like [Planococcus citri]|uniref:G-protein coupled receptor Mth2-like n=1 Tax=Planococcus citri TaxID=170843 RepID=UPI0031F8FE8A
MYFFYFILVQFFTLNCAELLCDVYEIWDPVLLDRHSFVFTIPNYQLPSSRGRLYIGNITCPCDGIKQFCLRKCCLPDDVFSHEKKCISGEQRKEHNIPGIKKALKISNSTKVRVVSGSYCSTVIKPIDLSSLPPVMDYCVDYFSDSKDYLMAQCTDTIDAVPLIYTLCLGVSIMFLLLTFLIYCSIQSLRNLPGKILLGYVASLLATNIFYVVIQLLLITEGTFCMCSAYAMQFAFLASFFWMNVMCFDLWRTFSGYRAFNGFSKEKDRKKFIIYCLYAWGCPALIGVLTFVVDNTDIIPEDMKPNLARKDRCWFGDDTTPFYYFYSFISVLLSLNLIMFIHTTIIIIKHKNQVKVLKGSDSKRHHLDNEKKRFHVYLKLFSMMGISWLMEILSYFYQDESIIWDVIDVCNMLQGTFIFFIFVCKRRVIILLNKKIYPKKMLIEENMRSNSSYSNSNANNSNSIRKDHLKASLKVEMITVHSTENKI